MKVMIANTLSIHFALLSFKQGLAAIALDDNYSFDSSICV
jgi:hypothetical protein